MTVQLTKIRTQTQDLNRVQENVGNALTTVQQQILGNTTSLVENVFLNVDFTSVPHGLGRPPNGFWVLRTNVPEQISTGTTTPPVSPVSDNPNLFIVLTTNGGPCYADILFF